MKISSDIIDAIKNASNVAIITHIRPDADALGSACSFKLVLEKMGKTADIYCDSEIPSNYDFIKYITKINNPQNINYDTVVALDCADMSRMGKYVDLFTKVETSINIDHHATNDRFGKYNIVEIVSSTGEILFSLYNALKVKLDKFIATALYSAIASDTGCFQHSNTTATVHRIVARLMKYNIDLNKANYYLFKRRSMGQIQLQQIALKNLRFFEDNKIALIYLKEEDFKNCKIGSNDSFGLVDICINIEKVEIGILISEIKPNLYACSIRGKGKVDVSEIAKKFGGGGHANAAGCNLFGTTSSAINKLVRACKKYV